jgi:3-oxoadipate enol-lactonase
VAYFRHLYLKYKIIGLLYNYFQLTMGRSKEQIMQFSLDHGYLAYERVGRGMPLLFIHGYPLSRKIWQPQVDGLSDIATIITIDLRGHGDSFAFDPPYSMDMLAEDCKHLLDGIGIIGPIVVCGLSMGGYVAFALYRKYPELFKGLILSSTRAGADSPEGKASRDASIKNVRQHGVPFITDSMLSKLVSPVTLSTNTGLVNELRTIMLETSENGVVGALQGMRDRPDSTELLPEISVPALIIHGANDQLISLPEAEAMHSQISGSHMVVIQQAAHLSNMEQPEIYNRAVRDFLKSLGY